MPQQNRRAVNKEAVAFFIAFGEEALDGFDSRNRIEPDYQRNVLCSRIDHLHAGDSSQLVRERTLAVQYHHPGFTPGAHLMGDWPQHATGFAGAGAA